MHNLLRTVLSDVLPLVAEQKGRNLFMPGDGRYQPDELKPFLGYDMWAAFLIIVEWFWLVTLAEVNFIPPKEAKLLTQERLTRLLMRIATTTQDNREKGKDGREGTKHDILALLELMRRYLPKTLHQYLHLGATSYDIICTAYGLILKLAFKKIFEPKLLEVDKIWREKILEYAGVVQAGRTHLQTALPVTVSFWLAVLHHQYVDCAVKAYGHAEKITGKFTGAVGTSAALEVMLGRADANTAVNNLMLSLDLWPAQYSTQIAPPQPAARFYFELMLLSGVLGNLGEDVRILQSSQFGEIVSVGSSSSTMAHKKANPIAAENNCGMHVNIIAEFMKIALTLESDLQRDLRWSSVMRSFSSVMVYGYQQLLTTERLLRSLSIDRQRIQENFDTEAKLVMGELLHLGLQSHGYAGTHALVNKKIVPAAALSGKNLAEQMDQFLSLNHDKELEAIWKKTAGKFRFSLEQPNCYIGKAIELAQAEAENNLNFLVTPTP